MFAIRNILLAVLLIAGLYLLLRRYFPNRRVLLFFCLTLMIAAGFVIFSHAFLPTQHPAMDPKEKIALQQQQKIFSDWYTGYKKDIDQLDHNWQQYHHILADFQADNISIQTTYVRLTQLETEAAATRDTLAHLEAPSTLDNANYTLAAALLKKTNDYANAQYTTIAKTRTAADPAHLLSKHQEEQSRHLQEIMIMESPAGLFTAKEISALKDNLTLPDEN